MLLVLPGCGKISATDGVDESVETDETEDGDGEGVGGSDAPPDCSEARLQCETYFPEKLDCTCDANAPEVERDCGGQYYDCDVLNPNMGCRCIDGFPDPNHLEKSGCLGAEVRYSFNGQTQVLHYPLCADELMGESNGAFRPSWATESSTAVDLEACLLPYPGDDVAHDSCTCVEGGRTPVIGILPEVGQQYLGCGKSELLLSARVQEEGFCAGPSRWQAPVAFCAWFPSAFAPVGWELAPCASCYAE